MSPSWPALFLSGLTPSLTGTAHERSEDGARPAVVLPHAADSIESGRPASLVVETGVLLEILQEEFSAKPHKGLEDAECDFQYFVDLAS
jgi:hypothetical protein